MKNPISILILLSVFSCASLSHGQVSTPVLPQDVVLSTTSKGGVRYLLDDGQQAPPGDQPSISFDREIVQFERELAKLRSEQASIQPAREDENARSGVGRQLELQQKQIDLLERMIRLVGEETQNQGAEIESQGRRNAQRGSELAEATSDLREQADAEKRNGARLPSTLKELFLPTRPNQTPLAFYGTLSANFEEFQSRNANFSSPTFSPHFYLQLNERFLLEANPEVNAEEVEVESAQLDWFATDWLTIVVGRFYSPLGFFNERLHTTWVYKTPDRPLVLQQVFPAPLSLSGVQFRGAQYFSCHPIKLEYSAVIANGFSLTAEDPTARDFADLRGMSDVFNDVNNDKAFGGRVGLSFPEMGLIVGISGLLNGAYDRLGEHDISFWDVDANWHYGNFEVRFEYAHADQQAPNRPIDRRGFYLQTAYRRYNAANPVLQKLEGVFRFGSVRFEGIDLAETGLEFGRPRTIPIDRDRYTVGINYYPYPSLVLKAAYEFRDEKNFRELRDDGFLAQVAWGF